MAMFEQTFEQELSAILTEKYLSLLVQFLRKSGLRSTKGNKSGGENIRNENGLAMNLWDFAYHKIGIRAEIIWNVLELYRNRKLC